ncbi:SET domain-containing protein [Neolewinella sp.]|uniref:SET domain-containing protein n=1 Tax=Neolewinella sp. TaxID=2993543 RepID=UPI003B526558
MNYHATTYLTPPKQPPPSTTPLTPDSYRGPAQMLHPHTRLQHISDVVGYGIFATEAIPAGTIVYVKDSLEISVTPEQFLAHGPEMQAVIDKYSYIDEHGDRVVSWDLAKYVNHCCQCNTISTGYGFEMALRDIAPGEQLTDEYGIFNLDIEMELVCDQPGCRKKIGPRDFDRYYKEWDAKIEPVLPKLFAVQQPLGSLLTAETKRELEAFRNDRGKYKSVYALKLKD